MVRQRRQPTDLAETANRLVDAEHRAMQRLQELIDSAEEGTLLSQVYLNRVPGYVVITDAEGEEVIRIKSDEMAKTKKSVGNFLNDKLKSLLCSGCGARLYAGEDDVCGPCEGRQLRELLEMRRSLG